MLFLREKPFSACIGTHFRRSWLTSPSFHQFRHWTTFAHVDAPVPGLHIEAFQRTFPYIWLRDSCPNLIHPSAQQKLHRTSDIPVTITPTRVSTSQGNIETLSIDWNDGHSSSYSKEFLARYASPESVAAFHNDVSPVPWLAEHLGNGANGGPLFIPWNELGSDSKILSVAIDQLLKNGLLFITGLPTEGANDPSTSQARKLANMLSKLKETFYGPVWDVINKVDSKNIAYTNLFLNMHMDLLYFEQPPDYQILHCITNKVKGGESLFVDALHAATQLREEHPGSFDILANTPVPFHYVNDNHHLHFSHPTIELVLPADVGDLAADDNLYAHMASIGHINYSPPFQAPLPIDTPPMFYKALARFARYLDDPKRVYKYRLKEGDAVVFDNRRILHARNAFEEMENSSTTNSNGTSRWLQGAYFEGASLLDQGRMLRRKT